MSVRKYILKISSLFVSFVIVQQLKFEFACGQIYCMSNIPTICIRLVSKKIARDPLQDSVKSRRDPDF